MEDEEEALDNAEVGLRGLLAGCRWPDLALRDPPQMPPVPPVRKVGNGCHANVDSGEVGVEAVKWVGVHGAMCG